jgi:hypothetical protein
MRGFFTSPSVLDVDFRETRVLLSCTVPALFLLTHEYDFSVRAGDKYTYLNACNRWLVQGEPALTSRRPRPMCFGVAVILYADQPQKMRMLKGKNITIERLGPITSQDPAVVAWRDFNELELMRKLTGEWRLFASNIVTLIRTREFRSLVVDEQVLVDPMLLEDIEPVDFRDMSMYRKVWEVIAEDGPWVNRSTVPGMASLMRQGDLVTFRWIYELMARAPTVIAALAVSLEVARAMYPGAEQYPPRGNGRTMLCPAWLSLTKLIELKMDSVVIFGDPRRAQDDHMRRKDLMALALATEWLDADRNPWNPEIVVPGAFPGRLKGVFRLDEINTRTRFDTLRNYYRSGRECKHNDKRLLIAFAENDPVERDMYETSQLTRSNNCICVAKPPADFRVGDVVSVSYSPKGPSYRYKGRHIKSIGQAVLEPFAMCMATRLSTLAPEDYDVVILIGDQATPARFINEAVRVGSNGATILCL